LLIVNGHGGNYVLSNIVQQASVAGPVMALFPARDDWNDARRGAGLTTDNHSDMHAGELETSILLHAFPDVVATGIRKPITRPRTGGCWSPAAWRHIRATVSSAGLRWRPLRKVQRCWPNSRGWPARMSTR
jgi:creatinine amidohydrolase/Fe(II)-dependent formamide hydrolase-like protein